LTIHNLFVGLRPEAPNCESARSRKTGTRDGDLCRLRQSGSAWPLDWRSAAGDALPRATGQTNERGRASVARAGAFVDQVEAALEPFETTIEIVEPTCEADVILVQAKDITAQVNNLTLDPGEPGNDLILLFAD
jgi:hypothetical protein